MTKKVTTAQRSAFGIYADCVTDAEIRAVNDPGWLRLMDAALAAWRRGDKITMHALHDQISPRSAELEGDRRDR